MRLFHSSRASVLSIGLFAGLSSGTAPGSAVAQQVPAVRADSPTSSFTIFVRSVPIGSEQVSVTRDAEGWTIAGSGRLGAPLDIITRRVQVRYDSNWKPLELSIDASVRGQAQTLRSTVSGTTITNQITNAGQASTTTATGAADILLPNPFFAPYEALAARLKTAASGDTIVAYSAPAVMVNIKVGEKAPERIQTATRTIDTVRTHVSFVPLTVGAAPTVDADVWADDTGRLLRLSIPAQSLEVVREDIASVAARRVPISRPNDESVRIQSNGFTLAGTISKPVDPGTKPLPAVVFIGGSGPADRDEFVYGIPVLGQLAGTVSDAGFITLRYDRRGVGQSGGRAESATLADFTEDLRAAVKLLSDRKDVDGKRIAVVGHSEGGAVALLAAAKDKRIAAVVLLAANGVSGAELVLEQQQHLLGRGKMTDAEKQVKVDLQKRVNEAVITGKGWEKLPADTRRQTDNAEFQSLLLNDPAKVMPDVRQPVLIVQGELDTQVAPTNADKLEGLARKRKNAPLVEVAKVPGVNHLLVPATTGEVDEYATLKDKHVSPAVSGAITAWLQKTLAGK